MLEQDSLDQIVLWGQEQGRVAFGLHELQHCLGFKALPQNSQGESQGSHCLCMLAPVPIQDAFWRQVNPQISPKPGGEE